MSKQQQQKQIEQSKELIRRHRWDTLKNKNIGKPDYREIAKILLVDTPSQKDNKILAYKELDEIQIAARNILELGLMVCVPTSVSNCACVHLYNFYKVNSLSNYDKSYLAVACLFMACKTEDHPRAINDIIVAAYNLWQKRQCKVIIDKRKRLETKLHELELNLSYAPQIVSSKVYPVISSASSTGSAGITPPSNCGTESPCSLKSVNSDYQYHINGNLTKDQLSQLQLNDSTFKSPSSPNSIYSATTPTPSTPDDFNTMIGISPRSSEFLPSRNNGPICVKTYISDLNRNITKYKEELKRMPFVRYLVSNTTRKCVIPNGEFFKKTKPKIERFELDLLCSIGFHTIVNLPHMLIVESKARFCAIYGESINPKIERIVYVAYDLATKVISLYPVQKPKNYIAAALIYLCGPFRHPVEDKPWWREVYGANISEKELIKLAELICDSWIATKDYYNQVHMKAHGGVVTPNREIKKQFTVSNLAKTQFNQNKLQISDIRSPSPGNFEDIPSPSFSQKSSPSSIASSGCSFIANKDYKNIKIVPTDNDKSDYKPSNRHSLPPNGNWPHSLHSQSNKSNNVLNQMISRSGSIHSSKSSKHLNLFKCKEDSQNLDSQINRKRKFNSNNQKYLNGNNDKCGVKYTEYKSCPTTITKRFKPQVIKRHHLTESKSLGKIEKFGEK